MARKRNPDPPDPGREPITFDTVRAIAVGLTGAVEGTSYGTPAFRAGKSLFVRLHDSGDCLVVRIDPDERAMRMKADPETFFITEHYRNYPWILVRLATVERDDLRDLINDAWKLVAPKPRRRPGPSAGPASSSTSTSTR